MVECLSGQSYSRAGGIKLELTTEMAEVQRYSGNPS